MDDAGAVAESTTGNGGEAALDAPEPAAHRLGRACERVREALVLASAEATAAADPTLPLGHGEPVCRVEGIAGALVELASGVESRGLNAVAG